MLRDRKSNHDSYRYSNTTSSTIAAGAVIIVRGVVSNQTYTTGMYDIFILIDR